LRIPLVQSQHRQARVLEEVTSAKDEDIDGLQRLANLLQGACVSADLLAELKLPF